MEIWEFLESKKSGNLLTQHIYFIQQSEIKLLKISNTLSIRVHLTSTSLYIYWFLYILYWNTMLLVWRWWKSQFGLGSRLLFWFTTQLVSHANDINEIKMQAGASAAHFLFVFHKSFGGLSSSKKLKRQKSVLLWTSPPSPLGKHQKCQNLKITYLRRKFCF